MPLLTQENVGRPEVAGDYARGMRGRASVRTFLGYGQQLINVDGFPRDPMLQRDPFQKLHRDEDVIAVLPDLVNRADVGMVERRCRASLSPKAFESVWI